MNLREILLDGKRVIVGEGFANHMHPWSSLDTRPKTPILPKQFGSVPGGTTTPILPKQSF